MTTATEAPEEGANLYADSLAMLANAIAEVGILAMHMTQAAACAPESDEMIAHHRAAAVHAKAAAKYIAGVHGALTDFVSAYQQPRIVTPHQR